MASKLDLAETDKEREDATLQMKLDAKEVERKDRQKTRRYCVVCATICFVSLLAMIVLGIFLASGIQIEHREQTEEYYQEAEGDGVTFNNGTWEQYNDNATNGGGD